MIVKLHLSSPFLVFVINESARKCDVKKKHTQNYLTWFLFIFRATMPMRRKQVWESKKDKMVIAVQRTRSKECKNKRADLLTVNVFAMIDVSKISRADGSWSRTWNPLVKSSWLLFSYQSYFKTDTEKN